uniref:Fibroblast growth factor n=1 Tax=Callorhinchus milii TaxID=7868 RepID=A0A4W3HZ37_CALMI
VMLTVSAKPAPEALSPGGCRRMWRWRGRRGDGGGSLPSSTCFLLFFLTCTVSASCLGERDVEGFPVDPTNCTLSLERHTRSYNHLQGDVRWRRLYSATKYFLKTDKSGKVNGTRKKNCLNSIMEIRSVSVGVVAIKAVHTGFYLAMNKKGKLYGTVSLLINNNIINNNNNRIILANIQSLHFKVKPFETSRRRDQALHQMPGLLSSTI